MRINITFLVLAIMFITACTGICEKDYSETERPVISENALVMATLYNYYANEYQALAYQAFNIARERVDEIRNNNPYKENLAIVVDIDDRKGYRISVLLEYQGDLGRKFIILPNAMYGNWPGSIGIKDEQSMDSLLRVMTEGVEKRKENRE